MGGLRETGGQSEAPAVSVWWAEENYEMGAPMSWAGGDSSGGFL